MAFLRLSGLLTSITGKLNGSYFSQKKGGTTMNRCGSKLTKADSGRQTLQNTQQRLAYTARIWKTLPTAAQTAWSSLASTLVWLNKAGMEYTPSGYEVYMSCNLNLKSIGVTPISVPVSSGADGEVSVAELGWSVAGVLQFTYPPATPHDQGVIIFASAPQSAGVSRPSGGYKQIYASNAVTTGTTDLLHNYAEVFGFSPTYGVIFFKIIFIDALSGIQNGSKLTKADSGFL